ncbi:sensor histidine kinase [Halorhabdus amylolytica]|uniref:sensor histidine kinase n=1 Tax=Halorhabdus amylolytica TaxID=2559573 RepID=UPI00145A9878|nr:HAMP domain-containing sensor histidine kinase [Halorhabdus amylolytica]
MLEWRRESTSVDDTVPLVILGSGGTLLGWSLLELVGLFAVGSPVASEPRYLIGYVTHVPASLGLVWGGKWLRESDLRPKYYRSITTYCAVGGIGFLVFNVGLMSFFPSESIWLTINWMRWALSLGLIVGLYIGIAQARTIFHTLAAERQSIRAEHLERQRDLVDDMNSILRHEVLNATQTILGTVELLQDESKPIDPEDERLERVRRQGEELTHVIRDVRSLLHTMQDDRELKPVNLTEVLRSEVRKVRDRHPTVDIDVTVPEAITVQGDELLGRVFGNLLANAVEHNDPEDVRIRVAGTVRDGSAVVRIEDDGDGIPERRLDMLFERPQHGDHGLGLYIVSKLLDSYGGSVDVVTTGDEGTTIEVTLPLAHRTETQPNTFDDDPNDEHTTEIASMDDTARAERTDRPDTDS